MIKPGPEDFEAAKADPAYSAASEADKYRLAQAAKLIRLDSTLTEVILAYVRELTRDGVTKIAAFDQAKSILETVRANALGPMLQVIEGGKGEREGP